MENYKFDPDNINLAKLTPLNGRSGGKKNESGGKLTCIRQEFSLGYNAEDSFIDNSEPFDECMNDGYDTEFGGFYVNSGPLRLKKVDNTTETNNTELIREIPSSSGNVAVNEMYKSKDSPGSSNGAESTLETKEKEEHDTSMKAFVGGQSKYTVPKKSRKMGFPSSDLVISADALLCITKFKRAVRTCAWFGNSFQFDEPLTELFCKILESVQGYEKAQRDSIFIDLEYALFLPQHVLLHKADEMFIKMKKAEMDRAS